MPVRPFIIVLACSTHPDTIFFVANQGYHSDPKWLVGSPVEALEISWKMHGLGLNSTSMAEIGQVALHDNHDLQHMLAC